MGRSESGKRKKLQRAAQLRGERRDSGLCIDCGLLAGGEYNTCVNCRTTDTRRRAKMVARRRRDGLCVCGERLIVNGNTCETCWFRCKAQKATGYGRRGWLVLKEILIKQDYRCA